MPYRLTKIYTRKGDQGYTYLGQERVSKDDLLIEALGSVDELNANIGFLLASETKNQELEACLTQIQHDLFNIGGELYVPDYKMITPEKITWLEVRLDAWNENLPPLKDFVLPRGALVVAAAHLARTVCRRAERALVRLHRQVALANPEILRYLNRLSDLLFVIARLLAHANDSEEILWEHEQGE